MKKQAGFTLIEMLIVLAIGILLAAFGFMALKGFSNSQDLKNEADSLVAMLKNAQEKALSQQGGTKWGVYVDNNAAGRDYYYLYQYDELNPGFPGLSILETKAIRSNLFLSTPGSGLDLDIVFSKLTGRPDAPRTIVIRTGPTGEEKTISITSSGKIDY